MSLNQLLHDEQVAMIHAASAKNWGVAKGYRNQPVGLDEKISSYAFRNRGLAVERKPAAEVERQTSLTLAVELEPDQLAGIDRWTGIWGISRDQAVQRLLARGIGETSHLMRSS